MAPSQNNCPNVLSLALEIFDLLTQLSSFHSSTLLPDLRNPIQTQIFFLLFSMPLLISILIICCYTFIFVASLSVCYTSEFDNEGTFYLLISSSHLQTHFLSLSYTHISFTHDFLVFLYYFLPNIIGAQIHDVANR